MGRKAVLAVVCWLTISQALSDKGSITQSATVQDNESAESAPRLYRNVPQGVYASAAPYASYSFQLPQFIAAPKAAASQVAPVKQKPGNQNVNTYLMDSYGNRYFGGPQQAPYRAAFPPQYVSLQTKLPEHLAQPLVAASPNFQFKQSAPQVFFGAPFRVPALQSPTPTPLNHFPSFGHLVYAQNVQSLAPSLNAQNYGFRAPQAQQQSTNNKAVFFNAQSHEQNSNNKNEPKFQRQQELPQIIIGKPKFQNGQESSPVLHGEAKFQRIQEIPHGAHGEVKFQRLQEKPNSDHSDSKFQRVQENPHTSHDGPKSHRSQEDPHETHSGPNYQRLQETPQIVQVEHSYERTEEAPEHSGAQLQSAPAKQTTITYVNDINGKTSVVKVKSEPLPLLDLTLLEPLTFANPLVPQVQHFLPRIAQATYQKLPQADIDGAKNYQKEFVVQKTMKYDSGNISEKPQKHTHKKKEKKPTHSNKHTKNNDAPKNHEILDEVPEIVYEINMPGHKETYKEKAISYNKETQSEPMHYSYGSKSEKEPVTYSFSRTSKEPVQIKDVHYHGNGQGPSHLIYNFKPEEQHREEHVHNSAPHSDSERHKDSSHDSEDGDPGYHHNYKEHPKSSEEHHEPAHKEQGHHHGPSHGHHDESSHADPSNHYSAPTQHPTHYDFEPITQEYEEDIRLLANAQIKVDPSQHVHHAKSQGDEKTQEDAPPPQRDEQPHAQHQYHHSSPQKHSHQSQPQQSHHHYSPPHSESHNAPPTHVHEKSKRIIIHEEAPDEMHMHHEQMKEEVIDREENNEEDFEEAYKNAAVGFPAYSTKALEADEKDIFDPESYGVAPDHVEYNIEQTPFQQYQEDGDEYPKEARSSYKDSRDKMKENYYTDYSISKPEGLLDRYQNKLGYYKLYKQQKPDYYVADGDDHDKKQKRKFAKYTVAPSFDFPSSKEQQEKESKFAKYSVAPSFDFPSSRGQKEKESKFAKYSVAPSFSFPSTKVEKGKDPKFAKYSVAPSFDFPSTKAEKGKSYYGHHKPKQQLYEYDYSKGAPRDSSAFASRPYQRYKSKTNFVEPQFQYGFEPISIPKLLDSELAAMASNHRPESEKPGMRKKVYKENWYIKKTKTAAGLPAS